MLVLILRKCGFILFYTDFSMVRAQDSSQYLGDMEPMVIDSSAHSMVCECIACKVYYAFPEFCTGIGLGVLMLSKAQVNDVMAVNSAKTKHCCSPVLYS